MARASTASSWRLPGRGYSWACSGACSAVRPRAEAPTTVASGSSATRGPTVTTRSADLAAWAAEPAPGERAQIGGVVGAHVDPVTLARFARALGPQRRLLAPPGRLFAGDWDACRFAGSAVGAHELELLARQGRLGEVEGAFALAWLDDDGLHLARDPVGERGAYYAQVAGGVAFASTLRPLLEGGIVPRALNAAALPAYLSFGYLPGRETLVEGVFELLPGQHLVFGADGVRDRAHLAASRPRTSTGRTRSSTGFGCGPGWKRRSAVGCRPRAVSRRRSRAGSIRVSSRPSRAGCMAAPSRRSRSPSGAGSRTSSNTQRPSPSIAAPTITSSSSRLER